MANAVRYDAYFLEIYALGNGRINIEWKTYKKSDVCPLIRNGTKPTEHIFITLTDNGATTTKIFVAPTIPNNWKIALFYHKVLTLISLSEIVDKNWRVTGNGIININGEISSWNVFKSLPETPPEIRPVIIQSLDLS